MKQSIRLLSVASTCSATMCIMSVLSINIGGIAFSLSLLAVIMSGLLLPPSFAVTSNLVYIALGLVGLPIFAGFTGGLGALFGKSGGFIISYPLVALTISLFIKIGGFKTKVIVLALIISVSICYILGIVWFMLITGLDVFTSCLYCVAPFIAIDICKCFVAYIIAQKVRNHIINKA